MFIAKLSQRWNCWRILEEFHGQEFSNSLTYTIASSFVCTSPLAVTTVIGLLDVVKVSISEEFKSFLLIMCIDAPDSTTNSLSSGLIVDGEGRHQFSISEKNVVLCFSLNFRRHLAIFHAASRAHRSCLFCLFLRLILKFWSIGVTLLRINWATHSKRWIFVSKISMTYDGFIELNTLDWLPYV